MALEFHLVCANKEYESSLLEEIKNGYIWKKIFSTEEYILYALIGRRDLNLDYEKAADFCLDSNDSFASSKNIAHFIKNSPFNIVQSSDYGYAFRKEDEELVRNSPVFKKIINKINKLGYGGDPSEDEECLYQLLEVDGVETDNKTKKISNLISRLGHLFEELEIDYAVVYEYEEDGNLEYSDRPYIGPSSYIKASYNGTEIVVNSTEILVNGGADFLEVDFDNREDVLRAIEGGMVTFDSKQPFDIRVRLPEHLEQDREIALLVIKKDGMTLGDSRNHLRADKELVLAAIQQNGRALQYASEDLRQDREVVLAAVQQDGMALEYAGPFRQDREVVLTAVQQDGMALESASEELQEDREVVLTAVQQDGMALESASGELQEDREVVFAAVQQDGMALMYADQFRQDREIVLAAVSQDGRALEYAGEELQGDREVVLAAVQQDGMALESASEELQGDREVVLAAVQQDGMVLDYAGKKLRKDREIVLAAVSQDGRALEFASKKLRQDPEVLAAVGKA